MELPILIQLWTSDVWLNICVVFGKNFSMLGFIFIDPFTCEVYNTKCRATGLGFATGVVVLEV